jgi:hypothetical protein
VAVGGAAQKPAERRKDGLDDAQRANRVPAVIAR